VRKSGFGKVARMELDGVTISWRVAECEIPPLEAVTVNGYVTVVVVSAT
jgi:hypothetical protein